MLISSHELLKIKFVFVAILVVLSHFIVSFNDDCVAMV